MQNHHAGRKKHNTHTSSPRAFIAKTQSMHRQNIVFSQNSGGVNPYSAHQTVSQYPADSLTMDKMNPPPHPEMVVIPPSSQPGDYEYYQRLLNNRYKNLEEYANLLGIINLKSNELTQCLMAKERMLNMWHAELEQRERQYQQAVIVINEKISELAEHQSTKKTEEEDEEITAAAETVLPDWD